VELLAKYGLHNLVVIERAAQAQFARYNGDMLEPAFDTTRLSPDERSAWDDLIARYGAAHAAADYEHTVAWVRSLQARRFDAARIRDAIARCTWCDGVQMYVGSHARTMPITLARAMVEQVLASMLEDRAGEGNGSQF
jgi:hypothetical protein